MPDAMALGDHLTDWASADMSRRETAETVLNIAAAGIDIARLTAAGPLAGAIGAVVGVNADGDGQKVLDLRAHDILTDRLRGAPIAWVISEEADDPIAVNPDGRLVVAVDPLDGSSNIDTNMSVGTIFSVLAHDPTNSGADGHVKPAPGHRQVAAGYIIYGPQTSLVLSLGEGTHMFTLDSSCGVFCLTEENVTVPAAAREFAINASNFRHWNPPVRAYVDDCLDGETGPRGENFNMRWNASLVAETHRILSRGGVFLYPADSRAGYGEGRLRLVYEANPIAWLMEHAGASATTGERRILDIDPVDAHQRVALIFGSRDEVTRIERYHANPRSHAFNSPLFSERGLFRSRRAG